MSNEMMQFTNQEGEVIGNLFCENGILKFDGDVDKSAQVFMDVVSDKIKETICKNLIKCKGAFDVQNN